ncbi:hypothetical protein PMAYCL1PPCAC_07308 [Pristionchus mayeri]|uniref:Uncharacterized protein n=1 Tax=Pristionchus mayeri TaxID=1317129 RepID=A0AAN5C4L6_9BILA|nr:hypothetical protein PMAYCL1PPCAC_07308 [Pristionchus mayeri]
MRSTANLRWRAAAAVSLLLLVLLYSHQNATTRKGMEYLQRRLSACEQNGESVVAKLKVVHEHKMKIDDLYRKTLNDSKKNTEGVRENLRRCELNHLSVKVRETLNEMEEEGIEERLTACEQAATKVVDEGEERGGREGRQVPPPRGGELQQVDELQRRAAELEKLLNETRNELEAERKEKDLFKKRVEECEQQLVAHVGAVPKPGYSANETAHFERVHDKDANLEFHRDGDAFAPPAMIPARELVRRLEEKRKGREGRDGREKDEEKHPQDRDENDEYVAEKPNAADEDYKEQEHS